MTLSEQQLSIIEEYIDSTLIDKAKLIDYLEKHRIIKNEVFKKCAKRGKTREWNDEDYCTLLDYPQAYTPVTRDVFIRRIPILFYCSAFGTDGRYRSGLWYVVPKRDKDPDPESLELLYQDLEFMFYGLKLDIIASKKHLICKALDVTELPVEVTEDRVSFPWFPGTPTPEEIKAYDQLIRRLCDMARNQKRVVGKEKPTDNEKYAFRCFLLRLGFIGDEMKAARKILLRNFSGNSAFKNGAKEAE